MEYLHTMVRVSDLDKSLDFYCNTLGLEVMRRTEHEAGRFTLVFLAAPKDAEHAREHRSPMIELTYNWDPEDLGGSRNFGHIAFLVDDIYAVCQRIVDKGITLARPPRDGRAAFVRSPDNITIELLQRMPHLTPAEPWTSMPNSGSW